MRLTRCDYGPEFVDCKISLFFPSKTTIQKIPKRFCKPLRSVSSLWKKFQSEIFRSLVRKGFFSCHEKIEKKKNTRFRFLILRIVRSVLCSHHRRGPTLGRRKIRINTKKKQLVGPWKQLVREKIMASCLRHTEERTNVHIDDPKSCIE